MVIGKSILRSIFPGKQVKKAHYRIREIIRKPERLHTLLKINEKILTEQSLSDLLNHIVRSAVDLLKVDVSTLTFAKLTGYFLDADDNELEPTSTATITDLGVGEIWEFVIFFPRSDIELPQDGYVQVENPDTDLQAAETPSMAEQVDDVDVRVGALRGSTVMP